MNSASTLTADDLREIGEALFGDRWQTPLSHAFGLTDSARIRQMMTGYRPIPAGFRADAIKLLRHRSEETARLAERLER